ncbi:helix-turn-helix domain-containing protein [Pseudalkalibacillus decolorationis]|uniref:helix-turn-helix domain-containing protein n=1 Tax=Pseudalkalibacillus decolorationis TaxID=163879 RepID=UPI002147F095|nr:helix-turn-helix domain-containing protein [Pseudalkalibacillus decolorationis]
MFGLNRVKSRLLYKYTLSYLLVFLIPFIIMSAIIYHNSVYSLRQEIEQSNINKLKQVKDMTDGRMKELKTLAARIAYDSRLTPYMMSHGYYGGEAINELKKFKANSSIIEELFVYYYGEDIIYSSSGSYSLDTLTKKVYDFEFWEKENLINDLHTEKPIIRPVENVTVNNVEKNRVIAFLYPIAPNSSNTYGTVMYFIEESVITGLIQNILGEFQGNTYIFDENNQVLASNKYNMDIQTTDVSRLIMGKTGVDNIEIDGQDYSLVTIKSEISGWTFVTLMDTEQFFERVAQVQTFILLILISVVFAGSGAAILLAKKQYSPIKNISELLKVNEEKNTSFDERNELESIRNSITKVFKDRKSMSQKMDIQEPFVRDQYLMRLLKGDQNNDGIDHLLHSSKIIMRDAHYFVVIVSFEKNDLGEERIKDREKIANMLSQVSFQGATASGVDLIYSEAIAVVVCMDPVTGIAKTQRRMLVSQIKQLIRESSSITPTIGVGSMYNDKSRVNRSFIEALASIEYKFVNGQGSIIYFEDISSQQEQSLGYPKEEQIKFIQSLKQGDQVVALETLNKMFVRLAKEELSIQILKCVCFDIINTVLKTVSEIGLSEHVQDFNSIVDFNSIEELDRKLQTVVIDICQKVEEKKESHNSELRNEIINYIKTNYNKYDLSLENTAEQFQLSVSYLSRFLKEQTGVTFSKYVFHLRIEEVKKCLKESNQSIKDIVTEVGYIDVPNFTRKFKKIEGVTPGQYRNLHKQ